MDIRPGDTIYGKDVTDKFTVVEFIGSGAFGFVYKLKKEGAEEFFALKTVPTGYLNETELKSLVNEGTLASGIKHENVVNVLFFHNGSQYPGLPPYIIMEYLPDGTLQQLLDSQRKSSKPFDNAQLTAMFLQLAEGMKAINSKLIHRDLKPDNILLSQDTLKISDFGLSKVVGAATRTYSFKGIQHIHYMPPEAWRGDTNTIRMDIYSMGIVFYELATLSHPYKVTEAGDIIEGWKNAHFFQKAEIPLSKNSHLDKHLSQLIIKMIAKKPEERYSNWDEMIKRIQTAQAEEKTKVDVSKLVMKAIKGKEAEEKQTLESERKRKEKEELDKLVKYRCDELLVGLNEIVDTFNTQYEGAKFHLETYSPLYSQTLTSSARFQEGSSVNLTIEPVYHSMAFEGKQVRAWGYFQNTNGKGFNVILVLDKPEDVYGNWLCLHNTHNPIARTTDGRPDPFPFDTFEEFAKEIQHIHALHIYQFQISPFAKDMLIPFFEDIL